MGKKSKRAKDRATLLTGQLKQQCQKVAALHNENTRLKVQASTIKVEQYPHSKALKFFAEQRSYSYDRQALHYGFQIVPELLCQFAMTRQDRPYGYRDYGLIDVEWTVQGLMRELERAVVFKTKEWMCGPINSTTTTSEANR